MAAHCTRKTSSLESFHSCFFHGANRRRFSTGHSTGIQKYPGSHIRVSEFWGIASFLNLETDWQEFWSINALYMSVWIRCIHSDASWWFQTFFIFHPENWGRWTHFDSYFFSWVGSTTNQRRFQQIKIMQIHDFNIGFPVCWISHGSVFRGSPGKFGHKLAF